MTSESKPLEEDSPSSEVSLEAFQAITSPMLESMLHTSRIAERAVTRWEGGNSK